MTGSPDAQPRSPFQICPLLLGVGTLEASGDPGHNSSSHKVSLGLVSFVCSSHHYLCPLKMFGRRVTFHFESSGPLTQKHYTVPSILLLLEIEPGDGLF
jgi:hypothetical protein